MLNVLFTAKIGINSSHLFYLETGGNHTLLSEFIRDQTIKRRRLSHKIKTDFKGTNTELLARDLAAINEFLHFVDAEPFVIPEKTET